MHIENKNYDDALQREVDYGRIRTYQIYDENLQLWDKEHVCNRCGFTRRTKIGIKVHLARMRNELENHYDLKCPYFPGIFRTLQSLNRHIRSFTCDYLKKERLKLSLLQQINWVQVWSDICNSNKLTQD